MALRPDTLLTPRQFVTETATDTDAIDLRGLALLGVMQTADGAAALLRHPEGRIARLTVGDHLDRWRVGAISDSRVVLVRTGEARALHLPGIRTAGETSLRPRARTTAPA